MPRRLCRVAVAVVLTWALAGGLAGAQQQEPAGADDSGSRPVTSSACSTPTS